MTHGAVACAMFPPKPVAILPKDARHALIDASQIDPTIEESPRRIAAINKAAKWARLKYPNLFKTEGAQE